MKICPLFVLCFQSCPYHLWNSILDLVKNRVAVMGQDMRKAFIGAILVGLIEKSPDVKVMKAITKMLEDWMKNKDVKMVNQGPNLKEKSILLVKLMAYVEKRFQDDAGMSIQSYIFIYYGDSNFTSTSLLYLYVFLLQI